MLVVLSVVMAFFISVVICTVFNIGGFTDYINSIDSSFEPTQSSQN